MEGLNLTATFYWIHEVNWPGLLMAILIIAGGLLIASLLRKLIYKLMIRVAPEPVSRNVSRAIYYIIVFVAGISALGSLGINLTGVFLAGGIIGIILGFALQSITANLFSGLFLYWEKPFSPGDLVEVSGVQGWITDVTIMSTRILGLDGVKVRIPNQEVFQSRIKNYSMTAARRLDFIVGIAYKEDAEKAYEVIRKVLDEHPLVLVYPEPDVFVEELGDSSVNIRVRVWVPSKGMLWYEVYKDLLWKMKKAITEAGIEIPFIQNDVWFRTPLKIKIEKDEERRKRWQSPQRPTQRFEE